MATTNSSGYDYIVDDNELNSVNNELTRRNIPPLPTVVPPSCPSELDSISTGYDYIRSGNENTIGREIPHIPTVSPPSCPSEDSFSTGYEYIQRDTPRQHLEIPAVAPPIPPSPATDTILPRSRVEFILGFPDHEIRNLIAPVLDGSIDPDTVFSLRDLNIQLPLVVTAQDVIDILKEHGRFENNPPTASEQQTVPKELSRSRFFTRNRLLAALLLILASMAVIALLVILMCVKGGDGERTEVSEDQRPPLGPLTTLNKFIILGGKGNISSVKSIELYVPHKGSQVLPVELPSSAFGAASGRIGELVLIAGGIGQGSSTYLNQLLILNASNSQISHGPNMKEARFNGAAATWNSSLLICGGLASSSTWLRSCEQFEYYRWEWTERAPMPYAAAVFGLVRIENSIYAVGSVAQFAPATEPNQVIEYDIGRDKWNKLGSHMIRTLYSTAATRYMSNIVVCGGTIAYVDHTQDHGVSHCEMYNVSSNRWRPFPNMVRDRMAFALGNLDEILYAFGGAKRRAWSYPDNTVELFDGDWKEKETNPFIFARYEPCVVAV